MIACLAWIQEFPKIVPGLVIFPFSLYFAWKRIGTKIALSYSKSSDMFTAVRVNEIALTNRKNKSVTIFSIHAIIDRDVLIEIDRFDTPIIVKGLETTHIATKPFSGLYLNGQPYGLELGSSKRMDFYVTTDKKIVKCKVVPPPTLKYLCKFKGLRQTTKETRTFNGKIFNDNAAYAIVSRFGSSVATAIVDRSGFIGGEWTYRYNAVPKEFMNSKEDIVEYLKQCGYDRFCDVFIVEKLP